MMCVECGADVEGLIDGACTTCYARKHDLLKVPDVIQVELCAHCGARHVGAHWHDVEPDAPELWILEEVVHDHVQAHAAVASPALLIELEEKDNKTFEVDVRMTGRIDGVAVQEDAHVLLRRTKAVCDRCSRMHGGFYAAIIQLRATERDLSEQELETAHAIVAGDLDRQLGTGNRFAFLAKAGPMHGGYDYYVGDIDAARNVSRKLRDRLGGSMHESAKLVGRREGDDVYRVTFLVRLHPFTTGDVVEHDKRAYVVLQVHDQGLAVMDLERHRKDRLQMDAAKRIGGPEIRHEAVVVNRGPEGTMILDPETQRSQTILVPGDDAEATIEVVRHEGAWYWVPRSLSEPNAVGRRDVVTNASWNRGD